MFQQRRSCKKNPRLLNTDNEFLRQTLHSFLTLSAEFGCRLVGQLQQVCTLPKIRRKIKQQFRGLSLAKFRAQCRRGHAVVRPHLDFLYLIWDFSSAAQPPCGTTESRKTDYARLTSVFGRLHKWLIVPLLYWQQEGAKIPRGFFGSTRSCGVECWY